MSEQRTVFIWFFAQEVDWCVKDCDKERLLTTAFIKVWKIFPGYTGDWFDVKPASTCTTELWDGLKSFILDSLKIKVAPHHIIVSLDILRRFLSQRVQPFLSVYLSVCDVFILSKLPLTEKKKEKGGRTGCKISSSLRVTDIARSISIVFFMSTKIPPSRLWPWPRIGEFEKIPPENLPSN